MARPSVKARREAAKRRRRVRARVLAVLVAAIAAYAVCSYVHIGSLLDGLASDLSSFFPWEDAQDASPDDGSPAGTVEVGATLVDSPGLLEPVNGPSFEDTYDLQAHRGGRDARPENTLYAFQYAIEQGATTIECDMQMTADRQIVLTHDRVLNPDITVDAAGMRVTADTYYIDQMTLAELRQFDVGYMDGSSAYFDSHGWTQVQTSAQIPTLRELFDLVSECGDEQVRMNIEAKSYPDLVSGEYYGDNSEMALMLRTFYDLVREYGFEDRVTLQSYDWSCLALMEHIDPSIETVALYSQQDSWDDPTGATMWVDWSGTTPWLGGIDISEYGGDPVRAAHSLGIDDFSPNYGDTTVELVQEAHELGMKVIPWTVNDVEEMSALYDMGVDGIITDRVWVLRAFLESQGEVLRPKTDVDAPYHLEPDHVDMGF